MIKLILLPTVLLFALMACDKINDLATFSLRHTTSFTIPSSTGLQLPINIPTGSVDASSSQEFSNNNTRADLVKEVRLSELDLEITAPSGQGFGFLEKVEIYIEADGLNDVLIASASDIPQNAGATLSLETTGADLSAFIKADTYRLRNNVTIREVVNQDIDVDAKLRFQVTADIL